MFKEEDLELTKDDWIKSRHENAMLIINNKIQIEMAKKVIELCDEKIAGFPEEKKPLNNSDPKE